MEIVLSIKNSSDIDNATQFVHDSVFDISEIKLDEQTSTLVMPFYREQWEKRKTDKRIIFLRKSRVPVGKYILRIRNVVDYEVIKGTQRGPGTEDFINTITYDPNQNKIWIATEIIRGIAVHVRSLDLNIEDTFEVVKEKRKFSLIS